jgi:hypothetical protein
MSHNPLGWLCGSQSRIHGKFLLKQFLFQQPVKQQGGVLKNFGCAR